MEDRYHREIERLLRDIPELERCVSTTDAEERRISFERSLKVRRKRFERLIPYRFRLQLRNVCKQVGVQGDFM